MTPLLLLTALLVKHFVCDFPLQRPYQFMNKGNYGHPGGLLHAGIHFAGSVLVLAFFVPLPQAALLALLDAVTHYHIDWAKNNVNRRYGLKPTGGPGFWLTFGLDQLLHQLTYIGIVWIITRSRL